MKRALVLGLACVLVCPAASSAVVSCPAQTPAPVFSPTAGSWKCQKTISKQGEKFLKAKMKAFSKCFLKNGPGDCPDQIALDKIGKAITKAGEKIAAECGDDGIQAGLATSYNDLTDPAVITSCLLSQHSVTAELAVYNVTGVSTEDSLLFNDATNAERAKCIQELAKSGTKLVQKLLKNANKCLLKQMKDGVGGDLAPACIGTFDGTAFTVGDAKTDLKQEKTIAKIQEKIDKKCGSGTMLGYIESIFGCPGARTVEDLKECVLCGGWDVVLDALEEQHSEDGIYVAHGAGVLQAAVGTGTVQAAANAGKKFLIAPGTYQEEVTIFEGGNGIAMVGCGGATDNRPRIIPPGTQISGRGIQATRVDGLRFQSLDFFDQANDHIRVILAEGVTFRDITGDGNRNTAYAVFPQLSNDVLVELCKVEAQDDAPLYVGQSSGITVRYNDVRNGVAGIEIENCSNADVHNNYGTGNTAGLLVFRDGSLGEDRSDCHEVHHNLFEDNNEPNFGTGTVGMVPQGLGILFVSNHTTPTHHNVMRDNGSSGLVIVDEVVAGFGPPFSPNQAVIGNPVYNNVMTDNGTAPDPTLWPLGPGYNFVFLPSESADNCRSGNVHAPGTGFGLFQFEQMTPPHDNDGTCVLPPADPLPGCPGTPIDTDQ